MKIFDNFCGFFPLEMSGYIYCGFNFVFSVVVIVLLLIFGELSEEKVVFYAIIFTINAVMLLALIAGIKMVSVVEEICKTQGIHIFDIK